jgi:hypothetical protein
MLVRDAQQVRGGEVWNQGCWRETQPPGAGGSPGAGTTARSVAMIFEFQVEVTSDSPRGSGLAAALREKGIDAVTVAELALSGRSDFDVFTVAADEGYAVLIENVSDFARISGDHLGAGGHHHGVLIALSSRFLRRPAGYGAIVAAVAAIAGEQLDDRLVYLERADRP